VPTWRLQLLIEVDIVRCHSLGFRVCLWRPDAVFIAKGSPWSCDLAVPTRKAGRTSNLLELRSSVNVNMPLRSSTEVDRGIVCRHDHVSLLHPEVLLIADLTLHESW
jgi:hypothetical protein